jgi:Butirosin biosynthesis protein H, N-terminal/Domain of unknown function (DUF4872)
VSAVTAVSRGFPHRRGAHCGSSALATLVAFHEPEWGGGAMTEADVFGIAGGLGFVYFEREVLGLPLYLLGRSEWLERDFCDNVGATLDLRRTDDPDLAAAWVRDELARGRPTMVWADIQHLDYLDVQMSNASHAVVVTGWDETGAQVLVSDFDRDAIERCSLESLARARRSTGFPRPTRHATWCIDLPAKLPDVDALVRAGARTAADNMRGGGVAADGETLGLPGLEAFAADFAGWSGLADDALRALLYRIWFCVVKAGTGGALFRSLQAEFLARAADDLGDSQLERAAAHYAELAEAMRTLGGTIRQTGPRAAYRSCQYTLAHIVELETLGVELLDEIGGPR